MHPATASDTQEPSGDGVPAGPTTAVAFGQARYRPRFVHRDPVAGCGVKRTDSAYTCAATAVAPVTADRITNDAGLVQF